MGGLSWQLVMQFGPDNLILAALSGPSTDTSIHSNVERIGTDITNMVMDAYGHPWTYLKSIWDGKENGLPAWRVGSQDISLQYNKGTGMLLQLVANDLQDFHSILQLCQKTP